MQAIQLNQINFCLMIQMDYLMKFTQNSNTLQEIENINLPLHNISLVDILLEVSKHQQYFLLFNIIQSNKIIQYDSTCFENLNQMFLKFKSFNNTLLDQRIFKMIKNKKSETQMIL
ncbi:unnamed protein product [Paramecium sonneborni]|uniref:Uncharacterized protein n=1 Tax=Paramecium sonneborni TaxID=65129 RepID=A0A8S1R0I6_9CILI|nr:unnamed protein product [Paramecium sonneborni]